MSDRLLIVGADGLLGGALRRHWRDRGRDVLATAFLDVADKSGVIHLDLSQPPERWPVLPSCHAAVLCAAITNLEQCRRDPAGTRLVNVTRTLELARRLAGEGCFVVFISSNLVYDGSRPMRRADEPYSPQTEYGWHKAEAEAALQGLGSPVGIVRLTKVFHPDLPLLRSWNETLDRGEPIHPFTDMVCSPIPLAATVQAIARVAEERRAGIWQLSGAADISYAEIARHLVRTRKCSLDLIQPKSARTNPTLESLPAYSTLDATSAQRDLGFEILEPTTVLDLTLPRWQEGTSSTQILTPSTPDSELFSKSAQERVNKSPAARGSARCHHCASTRLRLAPGYEQAWRVTSDCKPWPPGGRLALCEDCGLVQTLVTPEWEKECQAIYRGYTIYHQSAGAEQPVFDNASGASRSRSEAILRALRQQVALPTAGRWLDIGCGNGALLRACSQALPRSWKLCGSEVNDKYRREIESIPGVEQLFTGPLVEIPDRFDVISLVHVVEHIPAPAAFLRRLEARLNPQGLLLLEVPDCRQNAFSLMVADHCSHFSAGMLAGVTTSAGYQVVHAVDHWVPKEVTVVARPSAAIPAAPASPAPLAESQQVFQGWTSLQEIVAKARTLAQRPPFGIFGTSIAATWLDAQTQRAAAFFVDEDPQRAGRQYLDRPVFLPADVPPNATVFLALPPAIATRVAERLRARRPDTRAVL